MDFEIVKEPKTFEDFTNNLWIEMNNNFPYIVNRKMNYEEFDAANIWLKSRNIKYMFKDGGRPLIENNRGTAVICYRFQSKGEALLFNLGTS